MEDSEKMEEGFNVMGDFQFSEKTIRLGFIRKVYGILMCQLAVTIAIMSLFIYVDAIRMYSIQNQWMWILAFVLTFVILIVLACCPDVRRKSPINFIFLSIFTLCEAFLLGTVAAHYQADEVIIAVGITGIVALALTIFAFQTKWDFTMFGGILLVLVIVLICFGIFALIFQNKVVRIVYASLGALIFSFYLVFDTQMMMGGKHKYSISPEEYIFAALNLYLDIINLFLFILSLVGSARN